MVNAVDYFFSVLSTNYDEKNKLLRLNSIFSAHSFFELDNRSLPPSMSLAACEELRRNQPMDLQRGRVELAPLAEKKQRVSLNGVVA